MDLKRTKAFLDLVKDLQFTDVLAFGNILNVQEEEKLEDFVTNILIKFNEQSRKQRRELLKLAKDVAAANKDNKKILDSEKVEKS